METKLLWHGREANWRVLSSEYAIRLGFSLRVCHMNRPSSFFEGLVVGVGMVVGELAYLTCPSH